jgi:hypothetical protein
MTEEEWLGCADPEPMLAFLLAGKASDRKVRLFGCACCRRIWPLVGDERLRTAIQVAERFADGRAKTRELLAARNAADQAEHDAGYQAWLAEPAAHFSDSVEYSRSRAEAWAAHAARIVVSREATRPDLRRYRHGKAGRLVRQDPEGTASRMCAYARGHEAEAAVFERFGLRNPAVEYPDRPPAEWFALGQRAREPARQAHVAAKREEQVAQAALLRDIFGNPQFPVSPDSACRALTVLSIAQEAYDAADPATGLDRVRLAVLADTLEDAGCTHAALVEHLRGPGPHVRGCWAVDLCLSRS